MAQYDSQPEMTIDLAKDLLGHAAYQSWRHRHRV